MKYDVEFINPMGYPGIIYHQEADSPEDAFMKAPYWLSVSSQWLPDQFKITSVNVSIYEESK